MLHLEGLIRREYGCEKVQELVTKTTNGLGHWLTFVRDPDLNSINNRAECALREQVMPPKVFQTLQSDEGVYIHEAITMMPAAWQRRGLDPPDQLQSVLGGRGLNSP